MRYKTAVLLCGFLTGLSVSLAVGVFAQHRTEQAATEIALPAQSRNSGAAITGNEQADPCGGKFEPNRALSEKPHAWYLPTAFRFRSDPSGEACDYAGTRPDMEQKQREEERERLRQMEADLGDINRSNMMRELALAMAHNTMQPTPD